MDLAQDMIRFSGLEPGRDIAIEIIGARPGEKLHEQLFNAYEQPRADPGAEDHASRPRPRSIRRGWSTCSTRSPCSWQRGTRRAWRPPWRSSRGPATAIVEASSETARRSGRPRLGRSTPWSCSRSRFRARSRSTARTSVSRPSSVWPFCRCSTSPRRARSGACATGRAARPSAPPRSRRSRSRTPRRPGARPRPRRRQPANVPPVQRITTPAPRRPTAMSSWSPRRSPRSPSPARPACARRTCRASIPRPWPPRPPRRRPTEVAAAGAATAAGDVAAVQDVATGNGHGSGAVPAPATPAARRAEAPGARRRVPPRRCAGRPRRPVRRRRAAPPSPARPRAGRARPARSC